MFKYIRNTGTCSKAVYELGEEIYINKNCSW